MASTNYYGGGGGGGAAQTKMADYGYGDDDPYSFGGFSAVNQQSAAPGVDNDTQRRRSPTGNGKHLLPPRARSFHRHAYIHRGSVAEWLACWTQAQKGLGSNRSRDAVG